MKQKNWNVVGILLLLGNMLLGQAFERLNIPILKNDKPLILPYTGGIKAGQFSNIDLNNDGILDLFVFDRNGNQIMTFVKTGAPGTIDYRFAPEYISDFPKLNYWALLIDFNKDGVLDIFSASSVYPACIEVWKGSKNINGRYSFKRLTFDFGIRDILTFPINPGYTQIYVSLIDLPAIVDVDGDGDIDILTFEPDSGKVGFYKNESIERQLGLDSLVFFKADPCWGRFEENQFSEDIKLSSDPFSCAQNIVSSNPGARHSGSTLCAFDSDGDQDMDLLVGDLSSLVIKRLYNGGNSDAAFMTQLELNFPKEDVQVRLVDFLASFYLDIDGDQIRDLIITPNNVSNGANNQHIWFYKNVGTDQSPIFKLISKEFLINEMLFYNSGTHPAFADVNGDGLMDLVLGTAGIIQNGNLPEYNRMILLLNLGTKTSPIYKVADEDYLNFSKYINFTGRFAPSFGDLDDDGDQDLLVGDNQGYMYFLKNTAGKNNPMTFAPPIYPYFDINVAQNAKPQIIDLDNDGLNDIVLGKKNNKLTFIKNIGSKGLPNFNMNQSAFPNSDNLGKLFTSNNSDYQNGAPFFFKEKDDLMMLYGSEIAGINTYHNIQNNIYGSFDLFSENTGLINQGSKVVPAMADLDDDGFYEMAVGNERGGLVFYKTNFRTDKSVSTDDNLNIYETVIYPNPVDASLFVSYPESSSTINLIDMNGRCIKQLINQSYNDVSQETSGIYIVQIKTKNQIINKKVIII